MKKNYEKPKMEIIQLTGEDVIATSGETVTVGEFNGFSGEEIIWN